MFIPIGDTNENFKYKPIVTRILVLLNVLVFVYQINLGSEDKIAGFLLQYGAIPNEIVHGMDAYTLLTCIFLHGGIMHLISNMIMLWIFGDNIEARIGHVRFLGFYLLTGIIASAAHIVFDTTSTIPMVGASGAISGCLGAYLILFPKNKVKILFFIVVFRVAAFIVIGIWLAGQVMSTVHTLGLKTTHTQKDSVAYWAHIGGFIAGVVWGIWEKQKGKEIAK